MTPALASLHDIAPWLALGVAHAGVLTWLACRKWVRLVEDVGCMVLGALLLWGPSTGHEIAQRVDLSWLEVGALYPALHALESRGAVVSQHGPGAHKRTGRPIVTWRIA